MTPENLIGEFIAKNSLERIEELLKNEKIRIISDASSIYNSIKILEDDSSEYPLLIVDNKDCRSHYVLLDNSSEILCLGFDENFIRVRVLPIPPRTGKGTNHIMLFYRYILFVKVKEGFITESFIEQPIFSKKRKKKKYSENFPSKKSFKGSIFVEGPAINNEFKIEPLPVTNNRTIISGNMEYIDSDYVSLPFSHVALIMPVKSINLIYPGGLEEFVKHEFIQGFCNGRLLFILKHDVKSNQINYLIRKFLEPSGFVEKRDYIFGRIVSFSEEKEGKPLWWCNADWIDSEITADEVIVWPANGLARKPNDKTLSLEEIRSSRNFQLSDKQLVAAYNKEVTGEVLNGYKRALADEFSFQFHWRSISYGYAMTHRGLFRFGVALKNKRLYRFDMLTKKEVETLLNRYLRHRYPEIPAYNFELLKYDWDGARFSVGSFRTSFYVTAQDMLKEIDCQL